MLESGREEEEEEGEEEGKGKSSHGCQGVRGIEPASPLPQTPSHRRVNNEDERNRRRADIIVVPGVTRVFELSPPVGNAAPRSANGSGCEWNLPSSSMPKSETSQVLARLLRLKIKVTLVTTCADLADQHVLRQG